MALEMGSECSKDAAMEGRKSIDYGKNTNNGFIDSDDEEGCLSPTSWICDLKAQTKQKNNSSATFKNQDHYGSAYENRSISAFSPQTSKFMEKSPERQSSRGGSCFIGTQILHDDVAESVSTMASRSTLRSIKVEPRIVAPNVSKLSAHSAVEVTLACSKGNVAVLCSVDVLKMRSLHFHDILMEQELNRQSKPPISANMMWREPIIVEEESPFEAAALLESLHEGRALFKGDWNYCWARLSIVWKIEDLVLEYATQIESHFSKLMLTIKNKHWRTNPGALKGMRAAVFRRSSSSTPTTLLGDVVDASSSIGYAKIKVSFDPVHTVDPLPETSSDYLLNLAIGESPKLLPRRSPLVRNESLEYTTRSNSAVNKLNRTHGDVSEPFWVKENNAEGVWCTPDEYCTAKLELSIGETEKRIFWEMTRIIIELPEITNHVSNGIKDREDLTEMLVKTESRVLWTKDGPPHIPKEMATTFILQAYVNDHGQKYY